MFSKQSNLIFTLSILLVALLFGVACDKTPDAAPKAPESTQPPATQAAAQEAKASDNDESASKKPAGSLQINTAELRDQFQQEANTTITLDNAQNVLGELEKEINDELAELEKETPPTPAN